MGGPNSRAHPIIVDMDVSCVCTTQLGSQKISLRLYECIYIRLSENNIVVNRRGGAH